MTFIFFAIIFTLGFIDAVKRLCRLLDYVFSSEVRTEHLRNRGAHITITRSYYR